MATIPWIRHFAVGVRTFSAVTAAPGRISSRPWSVTVWRRGWACRSKSHPHGRWESAGESRGSRCDCRRSRRRCGGFVRTGPCHVDCAKVSAAVRSSGGARWPTDAATASGSAQWTREKKKVHYVFFLAKRNEKLIGADHIGGREGGGRRRKVAKRECSEGKIWTRCMAYREVLLLEVVLKDGIHDGAASWNDNRTVTYKRQPECANIDIQYWH